MSEEQKVVSEEEIKRVDEQVAAKQAEELKKLSEEKAKEIETKVRKEISETQEKEKIRTQLTALEEQNKKLQVEMEAKLKAERESFEARLAELEAKRKGISTNDSPFKSTANLRNGIDVDKLDMKRVEEESREAFKRYHKLPDYWGIKD
jgi:membrane protein involved in colicin uptake